MSAPRNAGHAEGESQGTFEMPIDPVTALLVTGSKPSDASLTNRTAWRRAGSASAGASVRGALDLGQQEHHASLEVWK